MGYITRLGLKKRSHLSIARIVFILVALICLMFSACGIPDAGVNGNGNSNGVGNSSNNPTGNCNGTNNKCYFGNSGSPQGNTSSGGGNQNSGGNSHPTTSSGGYCGLGTWGSKSVSSNDTIQGPAVINGVYGVDGHDFSIGGTNRVGYIAVLEDSGSYTVNSSGTACQPFKGTPTQSDLQEVVNALIQDQHTHGCTGGCDTSRIQKFSGGSPDGEPSNQ